MQFQLTLDLMLIALLCATLYAITLLNIRMNDVYFAKITTSAWPTRMTANPEGKFHGIIARHQAMYMNTSSIVVGSNANSALATAATATSDSAAVISAPAASAGSAPVDATD